MGAGPSVKLRKIKSKLGKHLGNEENEEDQLKRSVDSSESAAVDDASDDYSDVVTTVEYAWNLGQSVSLRCIFSCSAAPNFQLTISFGTDAVGFYCTYL